MKKISLFRFRARWLLLCLSLLWALPLWAGPEIQHWQTANGMRVYFVPAPELPMIDLRVTFDAGSARDEGKLGLAHLTNSLLVQSAAGKNADTIAADFEKVGAVYGNGALRDMAWVSLRTLTDSADQALAAFAEVLSKPDFTANDLERLRNLTLVSIEADEADPGDVADKAWYAAMYGDHPYATPMKGSKESVKALTREQVVDFYQRYYVARNGLIALTGNIDRKRAEVVAEQLSSGLSKGEAAPPLPAVKKLDKPQEVRIPFPSEQAHVLIGAPAIERGHPDYYSLYLGNHVLGGGGFTSRLVKEVRVKRGYAYSVYSYFLLSRQPGPYMIGLQTRVNQADDAVKVVRESLQSYLKDGPGDEELTLSKRNITGGFPLRIASNSDIVEYLAVIGFYDLPLDYLDRFNGYIEAVGKEDIIAAYQRNIFPENMVTVIVGGPDKISAQ